MAEPALNNGAQDNAYQAAANRALSPELKLAVTGASGWIGGALVRMAHKAGLSTQNGRLRILASKPRQIELGDGVVVDAEALEGAAPLEGEGWITAHLAYLGNEWTRDLSPETFAERTDQITRAFMDFAGRAIAPRVIFSSSGAVYDPNGSEIDRLEVGPYGFMKLKHERELRVWTTAKSGKFLAPRIFNIGGPLANKQSAYALTSMINSALRGEPIRIQARGPVFRSYIHVEELCALCLSLAAHPQVETPAIFDAAGSQIVELEELARAILRRTPSGAATIERINDPSTPANWYVGNPRNYRSALARFSIPSAPLSTIIEDTAIFLESTNTA